MPHDPPRPDFDTFTRWLAANQGDRDLAARPPERQSTESNQGAVVAPSTASRTAPDDQERYKKLLAAARVTRDEMLRVVSLPQTGVSGIGQEGPHFEVLQLLAAADKSDSARPPELVTARGFRVTLAYDEGTAPDASSICVLVRCPPELIGTVQGETAFLWNGAQRFELGQFDLEGKAIGTLPAGIEISLSDFAMGKVKLEEPPPTNGS